MKLLTLALLVSIVLVVYMYTRCIDGFTDSNSYANAIPRFSRPQPVIPKKPHPATNSNGGLVHIS